MAVPLRLVFMGSDPVALPLLDWLAGKGRESATLAGIFTGLDRPAGRGQAVRPNAVRNVVTSAGVLSSVSSITTTVSPLPVVPAAKSGFRL